LRWSGFISLFAVVCAEQFLSNSKSSDHRKDSFLHENSANTRQLFAVF